MKTERAAPGICTSVWDNKGDDLMKWKTLFCMVLIVFALLINGCAGMDTYQSTSSAGPNTFGCEGDRVSPFPPYCHPVR